MTLRLGFEAIGVSIDAGTFESRDDVVIAQDTMKLDERGAVEALEALAETLERLVCIGEESRARLDETEQSDHVLISYVLAGFEGAIRPV